MPACRPRPTSMAARAACEADAEVVDHEERGHAVAGVVAHDPAAVDDHVVRRRAEVADELEVGAARQPPRQLPRRLHVGEQDRGLAPSRLDQAGHALEVGQAPACDHGQEAGGEVGAVQVQRGRGRAVGTSGADAEVADEPQRRPDRAQADHRRPRAHLRGLGLLDDRTQLGYDHVGEPVAHAGVVGEHLGHVLGHPGAAALGVDDRLPERRTPYLEDMPAQGQVGVVVAPEDAAQLAGHVDQPPVGVAHLGRPPGLLEVGRDRAQRLRQVLDDGHAAMIAACRSWSSRSPASDCGTPSARTSRRRPAATCSSTCAPAASAAPTCTSPTARSRRPAIRSSPGTRSWPPCSRPGPRPTSSPAPASASPGSVGWTGRAGSAPPGARTCAWPRASPAWTATAATPSGRWPTRASCSRCPTPTPTSRWRRCCARA